jgi:hypothetical protein
MTHPALCSTAIVFYFFLSHCALSPFHYTFLGRRATAAAKEIFMCRASCKHLARPHCSPRNHNLSSFRPTYCQTDIYKALNATASSCTELGKLCRRSVLLLTTHLLGVLFKQLIVRLIGLHIVRALFEKNWDCSNNGNYTNVLIKMSNI